MVSSQNPRHPAIFFQHEAVGGLAAANFPMRSGRVYSTNFDVVIAGISGQPPHAAPGKSPIEELTESVRGLRQAIDGLQMEIASLKERLDTALALSMPTVRAISDNQAKQEIKDYFESLDGEVLYPSEIAENLNLDYEQVVRLVRDLVDNGEIAAT